MGACSSSPRCRYGNCNAYPSSAANAQGYCVKHAPQTTQKQQSAPEYGTQQYQQQYQPSPPPQYQAQPIYSAQPMSPTPQGPTLGCPGCQQPLIAPPGCTQMRCPRCQCVFSLSQPAPQYYTPQYQPQVYVVQQPMQGYSMYNPGYGYNQSSGMGSGLGTGLAVGGGLLGGLLLADLMF